jgi:DNA-binding NarL/FixJ family response regulator
MDEGNTNSSARSGTPGRVVVLASVDRSGEIVEALRAHGFRVDVAADINCVASVVTFDEHFVVLTDAHQPKWVRGVSDLVSVRSGARTLVLALLGGPDEILAALNAGVAGFVSPNADTDAIARSIHSIFDSGVTIPRGMVPALVAAVTFGRGHSLETPAGRIGLTDREWAILQLLMQRRTTREMAQAHHVSVGTVRSHVSALLRKMGAHDRDHLVRLIEERQRRSAS